MVSARRKAALAQRFCNGFSCALQGDIHNRRALWAIFETGQQEINLFVWTTGCDLQRQVWTVKAGMNKRVRLYTKLAADVIRNCRSCGRSEREDSLDAEIARGSS